MATKSNSNIDKSSQMVGLLQQLVAIELLKGGVPQTEIGKRLGIATGSVNKILKGVKVSKPSRRD